VRGESNKKGRSDVSDVDRQGLPIIRTKLYRPRLPADLVTRHRLLELLDNALEVPLTLVSAPAGYGKSVLVSQWAERQELPCVWLSLDQGDSELRLFLAYVLAAIETVAPGERRVYARVSGDTRIATDECARQLPAICSGGEGQLLSWRNAKRFFPRRRTRDL